MKATLKTAALLALGSVGGYLARPKLEPAIHQLLSRFQHQQPLSLPPASVPPKSDSVYPGGSSTFDESGGSQSIPSDWVGA